MVANDCGCKLCKGVSFRNCLTVSIAFFFVFSGFNGAQRFATSSNEGAEERDISLAMIYTIMPFTTLFVGPIIKRISAYKVFFVATACYVLYIAANIKVVPFILYICSILVGFAAPCLWIARNVFITKCSNHHEITHQHAFNSKLGLFNGIFWCIFQFSACLGSVVGGILFSFNGSILYLYALFTIICIIGASTFCCIRPMPLEMTLDFKNKKNDSNQTIEMQLMLNDADNDKKTNQEINDAEDIDIAESMISIKTEIVESLQKIINTLKQFNLWCLIPIVIYSGLEMAFDSADFPTLITDNSSKFYILGYYGFISVVASFLIGKISDNVSRLYFILLLFILHQIAWIILYVYKDSIYDQQNNFIFLFFATLFGIGFGIIATQKTALIPILLNNDSETYQCIGLIESPSAAFIFYFHSYLNFQTKILINSIALCIGVIPFFCFNSIRIALKPEKNKNNKHSSSK